MTDDTNSLKETMRKADGGDIGAMAELGHFLFFEAYDPDMDPQWFQRGLDYLKKASAAGNSDAMVDLGAVYYNGLYVDQDFDKAVYCYKKAADAGNVPAISNMGYMYYYGRGSLPVDYAKSYMYFTKAAMLGDDVAWYKVGDFFMKGLYVPKDQVTGFLLYRSCMQILDEEDRPLYGWPDVCRRLGTCFHYGTGTPKNLADARVYLAKAVDGFKQRRENGDRFTDNVLSRAEAELDEVIREMKADA